uniref:Flagellar basal-body rod protein FlgC n=1 Tax=Ammonifex degensii TaxID=42838 RepID=A0A7C2EAI6_9THEO
MRFFDAFAISGSGLTAQRLRLDLVANNLANIHTTRTPGGGPYRRQVPVFAQRLEAAQDGLKSAGVVVSAIFQDESPPRLVFDPAHPDADAQGYVHYPAINVADEMVDMVTATRSYEANATVFEAAKGMAQKALEIGRG